MLTRDTDRYAEYNAALRESYLKLVDAGDKHVFYAFGKDFYANDTHAIDIDSPTAAGCHPTDVGHYRIARHYSAILPAWMAPGAGADNTDNARAVRAEHEAQQSRDGRGAPTAPPLGTAAGTGYSWTRAQDLGVRGVPKFPSSLPMASPFHRFPAAAKADLTAEMWEMSAWG